MSLDGYIAGPHQDRENPLGVGGLPFFAWQFATRAHHRMHGSAEGEMGLDSDLVARGFEGIGAWIIGRNMFGPIRGPWLDDDWKGWWGTNPPYHVPVFVLTHYARASITMEGGTTFHFVTDGIEAARTRAFDAANGTDVRVGGGLETVQQYLRAGRIDEMHVVVSPVLIGSGERLFEELDLPRLGYRVGDSVTSPRALHIIIQKAGAVAPSGEN